MEQAITRYAGVKGQTKVVHDSIQYTNSLVKEFPETGKTFKEFRLYSAWNQEGEISEKTEDLIMQYATDRIQEDPQKGKDQ